jgi:hypothetical protein
MSGKHTAMSALVPATLLWTVVMVFPLLLWYVNSAQFRIFLYLLYPLILGLVSRQGFFWISLDKLAVSSIITFLVGFLLNLNKKNSNALRNPRANKVRSSLIFVLLSLVFLGIIFGMGQITYLYNPSNFGSTS